MKNILFYIFFISLLLSNSYAGQCKVVKVEIQGTEKVRNFKNNKLYEYYPLLNDFKEHFPESVHIKVKTQGDCLDKSLRLDLYLSEYTIEEVQKSEHDNDHGHYHPPQQIGVFKKLPSFKKDILMTTKSSYQFKNIAHLSFFEQKANHIWYDRIKYQVSIIDKKNKKTHQKVRILASPMAD